MLKKHTKYYRHLEHDPRTENSTTANRVIIRFKNVRLISSNVSDELKLESLGTPHLYTTKKNKKEIQVGLLSLLLNCHRSKISEYVDLHLQPTVKQKK